MRIYVTFQDVMESLDADSIYQVAIDCYNKAQVNVIHYPLRNYDYKLLFALMAHNFQLCIVIAIPQHERNGG